MTDHHSHAQPDTNPLLAAWQGSLGGTPAFDRIRVEHFEPALESAMADALREVDAIAQSKEPPTLENTVLAFEASGRTLRRVRTAYGVWESAMNDAAFQELDRRMAPRLAEFADKINHNEHLFQRISAVYHAPDQSRFSAEQKRLVWKHYTDLVLEGANASAEAKLELSNINQRLAKLYTEFSQNVLADEEGRSVVLGSESDLDGLPDSLRAGAAAAAEAQGLTGKWLINNTRSAVEPFLTFSSRRDLREKVLRMFIQRGDGGAHDNRPLVTEILELRARRANLLGFPTHAHWRLQDSMAKTPEATLDLMEAVWRPAVARVQEEVADMQAIFAREQPGLPTAAAGIEPWDYRYYAEKVRKEKYALDTTELKPYLQLERLREALFWVAEQLFDLAFVPTSEIPVYHPDVRVWQVERASSRKPVGLWYFDPYSRPGKQSGAWMSSYRDQERFQGEVLPIVSNNANFIKPAPGAPTLLSWDDAVTLFHEFGHALHGLCSDVQYPSLSGTAVARDFVEFPSQLLEHWLPTREVLSRFAVHVETGKPLPTAWIEKLERAARFNKGFETVEYLATALVDMKLHLEGTAKVDPAEFEKRTLAALGMPRQIVMRHRIPQLSHVFAGDSYSAGYYSYLWADAITADAFEAFTEANGAYDKAVAERLAEHIFRAGNRVDPAIAYRAFRGRDATVAALMRKRGFPVP